MDYKAEAEKIVEMFKTIQIDIDNYDIDGLYIVSHNMPLYAAIQCAIKHVEGILDVLRLLDGKHVVEIEDKHILILNQLKQM